MIALVVEDVERFMGGAPAAADIIMLALRMAAHSTGTLARIAQKSVQRPAPAGDSDARQIKREIAGRSDSLSSSTLKFDASVFHIVNHYRAFCRIS
jgi:hypothetical protein